MTAPSAPGNYISFFRFVYGDNNRFGQKVWCDILVKPSVFSPKIASEEKKYEKSSIVDENNKQEASPAKIEAVKPEPLELQFIDVAKVEEPEV
jgi:hypothetical protein